MIEFVAGLAIGSLLWFGIHRVYVKLIVPVLRSGDVILCDDPDCALGMLDGELHCEVCLDPENKNVPGGRYLTRAEGREGLRAGRS